MRITLDALAGVGADEGPPKLGDASVFGSPLPEPNEPEHEATAAPRTTQPAAAVNTRARVIAHNFGIERLVSVAT